MRDSQLQKRVQTLEAEVQRLRHTLASSPWFWPDSGYGTNLGSSVTWWPNISRWVPEEPSPTPPPQQVG